MNSVFFQTPTGASFTQLIGLQHIQQQQFCIVSRSEYFLPFPALLEAGKHNFLCRQSFPLSICTAASFERGTLEQIVDFARASPQDRF